MYMCNKIFCLGDGYAHGHIWPEWPQILKALLPNHTITLLTGIGAGNEFLISLLLKQQLDDRSIVIFQWAQSDRFDKIIQDEEWRKIAKNDLQYHFNTYDVGNQTWWLSSASCNVDVRRYHNFFIQDKQQEQRLQDQRKLVAGYLVSKGSTYVDISTPHQQEFSMQARFNRIRGTEIQPTPIVHYHYLVEVIIPSLPITIDQDRIKRLGKLISQREWHPYHPDRQQIWSDLTEYL